MRRKRSWEQQSSFNQNQIKRISKLRTISKLYNFSVECRLMAALVMMNIPSFLFLSRDNPTLASTTSSLPLRYPTANNITQCFHLSFYKSSRPATTSKSPSWKRVCAPGEMTSTPNYKSRIVSFHVSDAVVARRSWHPWRSTTISRRTNRSLTLAVSKTPRRWFSLTTKAEIMFASKPLKLRNKLMDTTRQRLEFNAPTSSTRTCEHSQLIKWLRERCSA